MAVTEKRRRGAWYAGHCGRVAMTCARLADPGAPAERKIVAGRLAVSSSARLPVQGVRLLDGERSWSCEETVTQP
jgi:hypothetical protein